jgi:ParB family chromosome partitioning protein
MLDLDIEMIGVDQISVEDRLRSVNPDHAALIAESFRANGQMTPIEVRRDGKGKFILVAGAHRLAAAKLAEMGEISATVINADEDQARLREIDENLCRRDLTELDRASFLAERKVVWAKLNPEAIVFKNKKSRTNLSTIGTFAEEVAERLGLSRRSIDRAINRHTALTSEVRAVLAHSRWADNGSVLDGLAKLSHEDQRKAAQALTREEDPARNLAAALAEFKPAQKVSRNQEIDQQFDGLMRAWGKATHRPAKQRFIDWLVAQGELGEAQ